MYKFTCIHIIKNKFFFHFYIHILSTTVNFIISLEYNQAIYLASKHLFVYSNLIIINQCMLYGNSSKTLN